MDDVFLFDPVNSRFLTSEYLQHPLITKTPQVMRSEQRVFYRGRWLITAVLLAALVAATVFLLIVIPTNTIAQYSSIVLPIILIVWFPVAYILMGMVIRQFTQVYDPTHDITLEDAGVVVLGEVQKIDWIKHRGMYWLTVRAHHPDVPDMTLHTVMPDSESQPQPGTKVALLYSGVWGTPFYKAEAL
jgi:hypothetical protein